MKHVVSVHISQMSKCEEVVGVPVVGSCSFFPELHSITIYFVPDFTPFIGLFWTSWNIATPTLSLSAHPYVPQKPFEKPCEEYNK